jgi:hypothetical protein
MLRGEPLELVARETNVSIVSDCHIAQYSPATTRKPKNQTPKPTVRPATAQSLAWLKAAAGARSHEFRRVVAVNVRVDIHFHLVTVQTTQRKWPFM